MKKAIILKTFFLIGLFYTSLLVNSQTLGQNIQDIRNQFKWINSTKDFEMVFFENLEYTDNVPSEGCGLEAYYKNDTIYKIIESDIVSAAIYTNEYYLKNKKLVFVYRTEQTYYPDENKDVVTQTVYEERVYYKDGEIIRHLEKGNSLLNSKIDFQKLFKSYKKYILAKMLFNKKVTLLQGTWLNDDNSYSFDIRGLQIDHFNGEFMESSRLWFEGENIYFHSIDKNQDVLYKILELSDKKLVLQNHDTDVVEVYEKIE